MMDSVMLTMLCWIVSKVTPDSLKNSIITLRPLNPLPSRVMDPENYDPTFICHLL